MGKTSFRILAGLAVLGLAAGSWGIIQRLLYGLNPVAFGSHVPWGLWVAFYLFFLGLSAGAFLVTMLAYLFGQERFESLGRLAAFTVLVCIACELLFITLDLGRFERIYRFVLSPSPTSLMFWMFVLVNALGAIYTFKLWFLIKGDKSKVKALSWLSLPVGLLFYGANGAFFAILLGRPLWNGPLTPVLFVVGALVSGGALLTFLCWALRRDAGLTLALGRVVAWLLLAFLLMEGLQLVMANQSGTPAAQAALANLLSGPAWWVFWLVHLLLGGVIPLWMFWGGAKNPGSVAAAALLVVIAFVAARYSFLLPDLSVISLEHLGQFFVHPRLSTAYVPNLNEWLVSVWVVSLGLLLFALGARYLPMGDGQEGGEEHA